MNECSFCLQEFVSFGHINFIQSMFINHMHFLLFTGIVLSVLFIQEPEMVLKCRLQKGEEGKARLRRDVNSHLLVLILKVSGQFPKH